MYTKMKKLNLGVDKKWNECWGVGELNNGMRNVGETAPCYVDRVSSVLGKGKSGTHCGRCQTNGQYQSCPQW